MNIAKFNAFIPRPGFENDLMNRLADLTTFLAPCDNEIDALQACEANRQAWQDDFDCIFIDDFTLDELYPMYNENVDIIGWEFETRADYFA